jgi:uncharacterized DUF497 family protein
MRFSWDPTKNEANFAKHGLWFEFAKDAFFDPKLFALEPHIEAGEYYGGE